MADFYWDDDTSVPFANVVVPLGHHVLIGRSIDPHRTSDHVHLATATRLGRILVTYNRRDFMLLHFAWRDWFAEWGPVPAPKHGGIVILPQPTILDVQRAATLLDAFVGQFPVDGFAGRCAEWRRSTGWHEHL